MSDFGLSHMAKLILEFGGETKEIELTKEIITIGRSAENEISLPDIKISRRHCQIQEVEGAFKVIDLGSANGTFVNGVRISSSMLRDGDKLVIGNATFTFCIPKPAPPPAALPGLELQSKSKSRIAEFQEKLARGHIRSRRSNISRLVSLAGFLIVVGIGIVVALRMIAIHKAEQGRQTAARELFQAASSHEAAGELDRAYEGFKTIVTNYADTKVAPAAKERLSIILEEIKRRELAAEEFKALQTKRKLLSHAPWTLKQAFFEFIKKYSDLPVAANARFELEVLDRITDEQAEAAFAEARTRAYAFAASGNFTSAIESLRDFARTYSDTRFDMRAVDDEIRNVWAQAKKDFAQLNKECDVLIAQERIEEAINLCVSALERFRDTSEYYLLKMRLEAIDALQKEKTQQVLAEALRQEKMKLVNAMLIADELVKARRYAEASQKYDELVKLATSSELQSEFSARLADIGVLTALFRLLISSINTASLSSMKIDLGAGITGEIASADEQFLDVKFPGGRMKLEWPKLSPKELYELYRRCPLTPRDRYALGVFAFESGMSMEGHTAFYEAYRGDASLKGDVDSYLARSRGIPVPEGGFVYFDSRWVTPEEKEWLLWVRKVKELARKAESTEKSTRAACYAAFDAFQTDATLSPRQKEEANRVLLEKLNQLYAEKLAILKDSKTYQNMQVIRDMKKELNARRKKALDIIFDLEIYPAENHGVEGQDEVDQAVDAVRELWDRPFDFLVRKDSGILRHVEWLCELFREIEKRAPGTVEVDVDLEVVAANVKNCVDLGTFALDAEEVKLIEHNRKVLEYNKKVETSLTEEERKCIEVTNEYRMMMGLKALEIDERLVQCARKHSQWMNSVGQLSHEQPDPERRTPYDRARLEGYVAGVGENCAFGYDTAIGAFGGWYRSSEHHRNMLRNMWNHIGIGKDGTYWTQVFGSAASHVSSD